jgi:DNA-binding transcriptional LysR family regulator
MTDGASLDQLRAFIAAADEGSFSAAGRRLKRAQSVVSQTVSNLEHHLGVRLFDRTARFPVLTDQGRALLANARAVAAQMDLLKARAKGLAGGCESELTVAVDFLFPIAMFTAATTALQEQFPETRVRLSGEGWGCAVQHVLDRRCAIGVIASLIPTPSQLARERLMTVKLAMVASPRHPLATHRRSIPTEAFAKHIQVMDVDPSNLPANHRSGVLSPKTWILAHTEAKLAFLRAGFGFGTLPMHVVEQDLANGALVQIRPENLPLCGYAVEMSALYRIDSPPGPAGRWLIDRLVQEDAQRGDKRARAPSSAPKPKSSRRRARASKRRS